MGEENDDVKPKLNITVQYENQRRTSPSNNLMRAINLFFMAECTVLVRPTTQFKKIFDAAEVRKLCETCVCWRY